MGCCITMRAAMLALLCGVLVLTDAAPLPGSDPAYSDIEDAYSNTLIVSGAATKAEEGISKFLHMTNHHDKRHVALSDALKKSNFGDEGHPWVDARVVNKAVNTALRMPRRLKQRTRAFSRG